ncbi:MAG: hypothetical protein AB7S38_00450 [Vulcanimicrobiota bacterium]
MVKRLLVASLFALFLWSPALAGVAGEGDGGLIFEFNFEQVYQEDITTVTRNVIQEHLAHIMGIGQVNGVTHFNREATVAYPEYASAIAALDAQLRADINGVARNGQFYSNTSYLGDSTVVLSQDFERRDDGQTVVTETNTEVIVQPGTVFIGDLDNISSIIVESGQINVITTDTETTTQFYTDITTNNLSVTSNYQLVVNKCVSPIVLDLDGDGKIEASNGDWMPHTTVYKKRLAFFDLRGNGFPMLTEWVGPNDGLLCRPKADGRIDGTCLFGTSTGYEDGYEALSMLDNSNDGQISGDELAGLMVWQDKNGNAYPDQGEVTSVQDLGITSLAVNHQKFVGRFVRNGDAFKMYDWWPSASELNKFNLQKYQASR